MTSEALLDELRDVLERPKFANRLRLVCKTNVQIVEEFIALVDIIEVVEIERAIMAHEDDDQVLACALGGQADYIVSGDPHLLGFAEYNGIPILNAPDFLERL